MRPHGQAEALWQIPMPADHGSRIRRRESVDQRFDFREGSGYLLQARDEMAALTFDKEIGSRADDRFHALDPTRRRA